MGMGHDFFTPITPRMTSQSGPPCDEEGSRKRWRSELISRLSRKGQLMVLMPCQFPFSRRAYHLALSALATAAWCIADASQSAAQDPAAFYRGKTGERLLRFCFAKDDDVLEEACRRLRAL